MSEPARPADGGPVGDPFGEVLPERAADEDPRGWGDPHGRDDDRLRDEVPPHHG